MDKNEKNFTFKVLFGCSEIEIILATMSNSLYHLYIHDKKIDGLVYFNKKNLSKEQIVSEVYNFSQHVKNNN